MTSGQIKQTFGLQESTAKFMLQKVTRYFRPLCSNSIACGSELGVPVEFKVYNLPNEQFVSYYGIRHIIA